MTIDEAIKHCLEVVENNEQFASGKWIGSEGEANRQECEQCAADHRQLAEWLTELKDLRAEQNEQYVFIHELMSELKEAKRLLKAAVEDIYKARIGGNCELCCIPQDISKCDYDMGGDCQFKWRYADEALKLIGGRKND